MHSTRLPASSLPLVPGAAGRARRKRFDLSGRGNLRGHEAMPLVLVSLGHDATCRR